MALATGPFPCPSIAALRKIESRRSGTMRLSRTLARYERWSQGTEPYPAEKARQGEIILRRPWQRYIFFGSLAAMVLLLLILRIVAGSG
jgi:hypothetical protein